jgi:hypothetical protein
MEKSESEDLITKYEDVLEQKAATTNRTTEHADAADAQLIRQTPRRLP